MVPAGATSPSHVRVLLVFSLFLLVGQVALEGQRWQMWPAYLVSIWLFVYFIRPHPLVPGRWMILSSLVLLIAAGTIATLLPVFKLPIPTGPFPIGTVRRQLVDLKRQETQGNEGGGYRELMVQIWYPASVPGTPEPYRSRSEVPLRRDREALVSTHAAPGVPISPAMPRYPVVIYTPADRHDENTVPVEELASHGFVVVGIDHPYGTGAVFFPDGRVVRSPPSRFLDFSSDEALSASLRKLNTQLYIRVADVRFVLDELARFNENDPDRLLTGHLDLTRLGIFGYSFGGAVAAEACRSDPRFKAGIDLDGAIFGDYGTSGVRQPFLIFGTEGTPTATPEASGNSSEPTRRKLAYFEQEGRGIRHSISTYGGYSFVIRGTEHINFQDAALSSPILKQRIGAGPIDANRALRIISVYTLAFFERYLNDKSQSLLQGPSPDYPEVGFADWRPPLVHQRSRSGEPGVFVPRVHLDGNRSLRGLRFCFQRACRHVSRRGLAGCPEPLVETKI